jgi:hypothetical protein
MLKKGKKEEKETEKNRKERKRGLSELEIFFFHGLKKSCFQTETHR